MRTHCLNCNYQTIHTLGGAAFCSDACAEQFCDPCPVCDEPVMTDEWQGHCSEDCLTVAAERQHEAWCERFYGGEA